MTFGSGIEPWSSAWEVPAFEEHLYGERTHEYALVIPVINEGERIRAQLQRICDLRLAVDVIVADGGSTDGSLDPSFIARVGVRAVLTKVGPGQLGSQLRIAYAWCLREGYRGIVTIDGNGKDGVEAVAVMVEKLAEGYDYVQGSRYAQGGIAENTPLERTLANRFIHAPLLSVAARYWFTDTTNGFRAYSAKYLSDPRVRPFRDVFGRYGLLFYLTVRAGQLGFKVCEVPVARRYPAHSKVPTKITGYVAKLALLGEAVCAATGGYDPETVGPAWPRWIWPFLVTLIVVLPVFIASVVTPAFSPDSWAYYELGQSVFSDFYRFFHFRSYANVSPYSSSFPPLFPVMIAAVDGMLHAGARSGYYLAFAFLVIFALLSEQVGRRAFGMAWIGLSLALVLLLGSWMLADEVRAGRTIPLQLVLYSAVLLSLLRGRDMNVFGAAYVGILCGLAILNRFDALLFPVLVSVALWWISGRVGIAIVVLGCAMISLVPWMIYSTTTFDVIFASDNASVAKSLDRQAFVTDWWPMAQPTMVNAPSVWLAKIMSNAGSVAMAFAQALAGPMLLTVAAGLLLLSPIMYLARLGQGTEASGRGRQEELSVVRIFVAIMIVLLLPQVFTGYSDARYFTALCWALFLWLCGEVLLTGRSQSQQQVFAGIVSSTILFTMVSTSTLTLAASIAANGLSFSRWSEFDKPDDVSVLSLCVARKPAARILILGDDNLAARVGALGHLHTMMEPRNMVDGRLSAQSSRLFLDSWNVDYVLVAHPGRDALATDVLRLVRVPDCPLMLFRVADEG